MSKNILIIGPNYFGYNESVAKPFRDLGWNTETIGYYEDFPKGVSNFLLYKLLPKMKINFYKEKYAKKLNEDILRMSQTHKPSLVLVIKGTNIKTETLIELKKNAKLALWMMDSIYRFPETYENLKLYDFRFMFEETDVKRLSDENIESFFLPMAADSHIYYPVEGHKDIDILFVGKLYKNRILLFNRLIKEFPDLNIKIYGKYTSMKSPISYLKYYFSSIKKYYTNEFVSPQTLNTLYSRSKLAINIHHSQSQTGCNPRVFEILATNTFQLVDEIPYIKENFQGDVYLASYADEKELLEKINFYLKNETNREEIAKTGFQNVMNNHTFSKRIETILRVVEK